MCCESPIALACDFLSAVSEVTTSVFPRGPQLSSGDFSIFP
jgi:hypothetical protein